MSAGASSGDGESWTARLLAILRGTAPTPTSEGTQ